jgi:hypothetical protein
MLDHNAHRYALIARVFAGWPEGLARHDILENVTLYWPTKHGGFFGSSLLGQQAGPFCPQKTPVLGAAADVDVQSDAGGFGAMFYGTLAQPAHELISGSRPRTSSRSPTSTAPVSRPATPVRQRRSAVPHRWDPERELYLAGELAGGSYRVSSDARGGTQIAFSRPAR